MMRWGVVVIGWGLAWAVSGCLPSDVELIERECAEGDGCLLGFRLRDGLAERGLGDAAMADAGDLGCDGAAAGEVCNGVDDDCDGRVDEEIAVVECFEDERGKPVTRAQAEASTYCMLGELRCEGGVEVCRGAVAPTADDICDGMDTDCDGRDYAHAGRACEDPVDAQGGSIPDCDRGREMCQQAGEGFAVVCRGPENYGPEVCDGDDNDCNGVADDPWPLLDEPCVRGIGECRRRGTYACQPEPPGMSMGIYCANEDGIEVVPGAPSDELCNDLNDDCDVSPNRVDACAMPDADCDGTVDEPFGELGEGCSVGIEACEVEASLACDPDDRTMTYCPAVAGVAQNELCDAVGNDCDPETPNNWACACAYQAADVLRGFTDPAMPRVVQLPAMEGSRIGLSGRCTDQDQERDEVVLPWRLPDDQPRYALIDARGEGNPQVFLRAPCYPRGVDGTEGVERGCALDSGAWSDEGRATMMVEVPPGAGVSSIVVEAQEGAAPGAQFEVRVLDPTWRSVVGDADDAAGRKRLFIHGACEDGECDDGELCAKRIASGSAGELPTFEMREPGQRVAEKWEDERFCIDNDGWRRSVEVPWALLTDMGVGAEMLPVQAGEAGDWWSTVVPDDVLAGFEVRLDPYDADSACAANSVELVARVTCTRAAALSRQGCGAPGDGLSGLVCATTDAAEAAIECRPDVLDDLSVPRQILRLGGLQDGGCRAAGGELVLHVGVLRAESARARGCTEDMTDTCGGVGVMAGAGETVAAGEGFRYRLRLRVSH